MIMLIALAMMASACSSGSGYRSVSTSPSSLTAQNVDVTVTATFSGDIIMPSVWSDDFTLTLNGSGANLCTGYNYDTPSRTVACLHDDLEFGSTYQILVNTFGNVRGTVTTFTTIAVPAMITKRPLLSAESPGAAAAVTIAFAHPLPLELSPQVLVAAPDGTTAEAADCSWNDDRTAFTCTMEDAPEAQVVLSGDGIQETTAKLSAIPEESPSAEDADDR